MEMGMRRGREREMRGKLFWRQKKWSTSTLKTKMQWRPNVPLVWKRGRKVSQGKLCDDLLSLLPQVLGNLLLPLSSPSVSEQEYFAADSFSW